MGIRGELFSTKVILQNRTYFFNVKENRLGDLYLNIVESKNRDEGGFERQSVILFAEDLTEFLQGFDESLKVLEKAVREKRRAKKDWGDKPKVQKFDDAKTDVPDGYGRERKPRYDDDGPKPRPYERKSSGTGRPRPAPYGESDRGPSKPGSRRGSFSDRGPARPGSRRGSPSERGSSRRESGPRSGEYRSDRKQDDFPRKKRVVVRKK